MQTLQRKSNSNGYLLIGLSYASAALGDLDAAYRQSDQAATELTNDAIGLPQATQAQASARMLGGDKAQAVRCWESNWLCRTLLAIPRRCFGSVRCGIYCARSRASKRSMWSAIPLQTMPAR